MDEYKQSPRVEHVAGNLTYNQHEHHYHAPPKPDRPSWWRWAAAGVAALTLGGGALATTHLSTKVYYCASRNSVKYHTDATCLGLKQCGGKVKALSLAQARSKMDHCKMCH